ncbi:pyridoxal phosphate-dependent transferase [Lanmaoa asiatica]|nr:pyridoxal phosphate-dependent transferase [Lanmaoa asiatica]
MGATSLLKSVRYKSAHVADLSPSTSLHCEEMSGPVMVEDQPGAPPPDINGGVNGRESPKVKYLPAEYYDCFLSQAARDLKLAPSMLSFLAGKPSEDVFPFTSISFTTTSPRDPSKEITTTLASSTLKEVLQYAPTDGMPKVKEWIMGLQEYMHMRKHGEGWTVTMGVGSQDVAFKAIKALINHGDAILIESPAYALYVIPMKRFNLQDLAASEVETDPKGVNPASMRKILANWPEGKPKPKLLYTVPYGGNPAGMTTTVERRREILALAREHDFLIMEGVWFYLGWCTMSLCVLPDDPYYWLYYSDDERPPSYFQLELELPEVGRVLRFDSFSKIISAGMRFGWASGPKVLIDAINVQTGSSNLQASSVVQAMVLGLMEQWGYDGLKTFTRNVSNIYRTKRDIFDKALQEHMADLAEWSKPESGMFFWIKLLPNPNGDGEGDSEELILTKAFQNGVLALPGTSSLPNGQKSAHVRLTFSLLPEEMMHEALRRLRTVLVRERKGQQQ